MAFKLSWSKNGLDLCTGTDDRTIKVWTNVGIVHNKQAITIENSKLTLYGHPGRVLDCKMLSKLLISSGYVYIFKKNRSKAKINDTKIAKMDKLVYGI